MTAGEEGRPRTAVPVPFRCRDALEPVPGTGRNAARPGTAPRPRPCTPGPENRCLAPVLTVSDTLRGHVPSHVRPRPVQNSRQPIRPPPENREPQAARGGCSSGDRSSRRCRPPASSVPGTLASAVLTSVVEFRRIRRSPPEPALEASSRSARGCAACRPRPRSPRRRRPRRGSEAASARRRRRRGCRSRSRRPPRG